MSNAEMKRGLDNKPPIRTKVRMGDKERTSDKSGQQSCTRTADDPPRTKANVACTSAAHILLIGSVGRSKTDLFCDCDFTS